MGQTGINVDRYFNRPLTGIEKEILQYVADGMTNEEISAKTKYADSTIRSIKRRILRIVDAENTVNAVAWGFRNGIIK